MDFMENLKNTLGEEFNVSVTENGAVGYRTTGKALLDINFAISSLRNESDSKIEQRYEKVFFENKLLAVLWLFYAGDVRGGIGERRLFRIGLKYLAEHEPEIAVKLLPLVAEYTRWDNLLPLLKTGIKDEVCAILKAQINEDMEKMNKGEAISLCGKWMPSINTSSSLTKFYAKTLIKAWGVTERQYRKMLSALRAYTNVVEVRMSKGDWEGIDYEAVPSKANLVYNSAFLRNDEQRRREYLGKLEKGEATINAGALFPHDVVHKYFSVRGWSVSLNKTDTTLEQLWKALPDFVNGAGNTICVSDGSGSMTTKIGKTQVSALEVAIALSIYFAERSSGQYKDKYITFSENPQLVDFSHAKSLRDKIGVAISHSEVANTNIEAVFKLILKTAIKNGLSQDEMPSNILILSDMEFDGCATSDSYGWARTAGFKKLFAVIGEEYERHGYKLPRLVFWNLCSRTGTIPVKDNALGVALVSGFSPAIMNMVLSGKLDPLECLLDQITVQRYLPVQEAIKGLV